VQSKTPKGTIHLSNAKVFGWVAKADEERPLSFNVRSNGEDFLLRAPDHEQKKQWVLSLNALVHSNMLSPPPRRASVNSDGPKKVA
jgi:hypothetical protein